jgi:hypothetical protein
VGNWTFLTNHAGVLACIAKEPGIRLRDIATRVDITERAAHNIVSELEDEGYLTRHKVGTRNLYELHPNRPLRPPAESGLSIGDLLRVLLDRGPRDPEPAPEST